MNIVANLKPRDLKRLHRIPPNFREVVYIIKN